MAEAAKRNTLQKQLVESVVLSACDHPTAETVYKRSRAQIPNISLGTVYRILTELVGSGKVREVSVPGAPSRFDKTTRMHAHFFCRNCGEVTDIELDENKVLEEASELNDNEIDEAEIIFRGLCPKCARAKREEL